MVKEVIGLINHSSRNELVENWRIFTEKQQQKQKFTPKDSSFYSLKKDWSITGLAGQFCVKAGF